MTEFKFLFITNNPDIAAYAVESGVDRIFIDLEIHGKESRQGHLSTVISRHRITDVPVVREAVPNAELLVRVNPWHEQSQEEIEAAIASGANLLMLPMFRSRDEVSRFSEVVNGRAGVVPLVETPEAMDELDAVSAIEGVSELYLGLNDLHLALGMKFMFQLLADGTVDRFASVANRAALDFGFGGIARVGAGELPAECIIREHARLGSTRVILSRAFHQQAASLNELKERIDLPREIGRLRDAYGTALSMSAAELEANRHRVRQIVDSIVS